MSPDTLFKKNLASLSKRHPRLAVRLVQASRKRGLEFMEARSGLIVPVLSGEEGARAFHSRFDPIEEGKRYLARVKEKGFLVFLGLGAGYHIIPFLERNELFGCLIVDTDLDLVRTICEKIDMSRIFDDPRVRLTIDSRPSESIHELFGTYIPHLAGGLETVVLPGRTAVDRSFFEQTAAHIRQAIEEYARDLPVQVRFGKNWFLNWRKRSFR